MSATLALLCLACNPRRAKQSGEASDGGDSPLPLPLLASAQRAPALAPFFSPLPPNTSYLLCPCTPRLFSHLPSSAVSVRVCSHMPALTRAPFAAPAFHCYPLLGSQQSVARRVCNTLLLCLLARSRAAVTMPMVGQRRATEPPSRTLSSFSLSPSPLLFHSPSLSPSVSLAQGGGEPVCCLRHPTCWQRGIQRAYSFSLLFSFLRKRYFKKNAPPPTPPPKPLVKKGIKVTHLCQNPNKKTRTLVEANKVRKKKQKRTPKTYVRIDVRPRTKFLCLTSSRLGALLLTNSAHGT